VIRNPSRFALAAALLAGSAFASCAVAQGTREADAVQAVVRQQAVAWNHHDAGAYSALFTRDCDVVNLVGWWWKSRAELQSKLARAFSWLLRDSTLRFSDVEVRFLARDIAVAHARWTMAGARVSPGMPPPEAGIQTLVLKKRAGVWRIAEFQNTVSKPEQPFPVAPKLPATGSR
jgi:uncharacterized protein (TIGR02246 family)